MKGELIVITVCSILIISLIGFLVYVFYSYMKKIFTCPYSKSEITLEAYVDFTDKCKYHYIDGVWYCDVEVTQIENSWDEAKLSEPVSTLLSLIYKDFDNFEYRLMFGGMQLDFRHKLLDNIRGEVEEYRSAVIRIFNKDIKISPTESNAIRHFFHHIHRMREKHEKILENVRLQKERESATNMIVGKINEYLGGK